MLFTILFALLFIAIGIGGYLLFNARLHRRKYSVATVKEWWHEEYEDSGRTRTKTVYEVGFVDTNGTDYSTTFTRWSDNADGFVQTGDEQDVLYNRTNALSPPESVDKVTSPKGVIGIYLALFFFGVYLLGFPLFNRVLVWLLPTTH